MKVEKISGAAEKQILIGMIMDETVCATISAKWDLKGEEGFFDLKWANIVGRWCVKHFHKYGKAPKEDIQALFENWSAKASDVESVEIVERFLTGLSKRYVKKKRKINAPMVIDMASEYFNTVAAERLLKEAEHVLQSEGAEKFHSLINKVSPIEIGSGSSENIFVDRVHIDTAFIQKQKPLIRYEGDADVLLGDIFERDSLVCFMAPSKTGKTFWLIDTAHRGLKAGHNVALFQCGDLSSRQLTLRWGVKLARKPLNNRNLLQQIPTSLEYVGGKLFRGFREKRFDTTICSDDAWKAFQKFVPDKKRNPYKQVVRPNNSININQIRSIIKNWQRVERWVPDIVVIDYADILAPIDGRGESRQQVNETWKGMRALSQEYHCCLVTATQTNAASYEAEVITRSNFSEDRRKNDHVTAMIAINQEDHERPLGLQRLNIVQLREDQFDPEQQLVVAGCLGLGNPMYKSVMRQKEQKDYKPSSKES